MGEPHFDLMIEYGASGNRGLMTWRSPVWPITSETQLESLGDHRVEYLTYEGPVSGNRGSVRRVASGTYNLHINDVARDITLRFLDGPPHPPLHIDPDSRCRPLR